MNKSIIKLLFLTTLFAGNTFAGERHSPIKPSEDSYRIALLELRCRDAMGVDDAFSKYCKGLRFEEGRYYYISNLSSVSKTESLEVYLRDAVIEIAVHNAGCAKGKSEKGMLVVSTEETGAIRGSDGVIPLSGDNKDPKKLEADLKTTFEQYGLKGVIYPKNNVLVIDRSVYSDKSTCFWPIQSYLLEEPKLRISPSTVAPAKNVKSDLEYIKDYEAEMDRTHQEPK